MKNLKLLLLSLLLIANFTRWLSVAEAQTPVGTINIDGKEVELFYKVKGSTPAVVVPDPVVIPAPTAGTFTITQPKASNCNIKNEKEITFSAVGGSGKYLIGYGENPIIWDDFLNKIYVPQNAGWTVIIKDKITQAKIKLEIKTNWCGEATDFFYKLLNGAVNVPPIIETENNQVDNSKPIPNNNVSLPNPTKYQRESANIGQWYQSEQKFRLLANTHGDHPDNYYYVVTDSDGKIVYENFGKRPKMPTDRQADYQGDHPNESQLALKNGSYKLLVINRGEKDLLFGVITKNEYIQYNKGGLSWADWYVRLKKGESASKTFEWSEKSNKDAIINGGYCKCDYLVVKNPFYKDGVVYIEEMRIPGSPYGVEIKQSGSTPIKYFSAVEPDHNITIEYQGGGTGQPVKYRVLEKNNLDLDPTTFMASPWNTSYVKFFAHDANTFPDSPDYVAK